MYVNDTFYFFQIAANGVDIPNAAIYIWIFGIIIAGLAVSFRQISRYRRINKFLRNDTKEITGKEDGKVIRECITNSRMEEHVRVYRCKDADTPFTIGIIRPIIVLPDIEWTQTDLAFTMKHEMIHIRQKDNLIKMLSLGMIALNFYNPLAYLALREWNNVAELSCDSKVILGMTEDEITQYGLLVIRMAEERSDGEGIPIVGLNMQNRIMKERMRQMKKGTRKEGVLKKLAGAGIMGVMLFSSSLSVLAYSPKNVMYTDEVADDIFFYEKDAAPWGEMFDEPVLNETVEWTFISADGTIVESVDESEIEAETYSACNHDYVSGEMAKHFKYSDGSCKIEYYDAQRCSKCRKYIIGDLTRTVIYCPCPH